VLLREAEAVVALDGEPTWIVGNHESNGFYRVALADDRLEATAAASLGSLSAAERYGLVEDEWALLLAGGGSLARVRAVADALADDSDLVVWRRLTTLFASLRRMAGLDHRAHIEAWVRSLAGPALDRLGDRPAAGEPERTGALRAVLFEAVARTGADPDRRAQAVGWFDELATTWPMPWCAWWPPPPMIRVGRNCADERARPARHKTGCATKGPWPTAPIQTLCSASVH
jgi:aminopeptidase N